MTDKRCLVLTCGADSTVCIGQIATDGTLDVDGECKWSGYFGSDDHFQTMSTGSAIPLCAEMALIENMSTYSGNFCRQ